MRVSLLLVLLIAACGPSATARQAQGLIDRGDYAGAAQVAAGGLDKNPKDGDLWRVRMRAALGQNDARSAVGFYEQWRGIHGADDRQAMRMMALTTIFQALSSPSVPAKVAAIQVVERLEIERLADAVADKMQDDDDQVAAAAAVAILRSYPGAPQTATQMLQSEDAVARAIAVEGIARKVGKRAADDLRPLVADPDAHVRREVVRALAGFADPADTPALLKLAADADPDVRAAALSALARGNRGDQRALAKGALGDQRLGVRIAAIDLLLSSGDRDDVVALLTGPDVVLGVHAARALGKEGGAAAAAALDRGLADTDWTVRATALNASEPVVGRDGMRERASNALADKDLGVRLAAARLLGDDPRAIAVFGEALADPNEGLGAAIDLARLGDPRGLATLGTKIAATDPATRRAAAEGYLAARAIDHGVVAGLADDDPLVRIAAADAILDATRND